MNSFKTLIGKNPSLNLALRLAVILAGLFFMANGILLIINSGLGANPWGVLHLGISYKTGIRLGYIMQIVSLLLICFSFLLGIKPRLGTFFAVFFIGIFVNMIENLAYVPYPEAFYAKITMNLLGIALMGTGTALYIRSNLGAGPRDSLMLGLVKRTGRRTAMVRTIMEVTVTSMGYILGGPVGLGTLLFCILVGWFVELGYYLFRPLTHLFFLENKSLPERLPG